MTYNYYFRPGCLPADPPKPIIVSAPTHGRLTVRLGRGVDEENNSCRGRPNRSVGVVYRSTAKFTGSDSFTIHWSFPERPTIDVTRTYSFTITP